MGYLLVGRDVEEGQLRELVRDVAAGQGRSVLVEGEPGIGKSLLVSAGLAEADRLGCRVLRGAADEFGGRFPLRVLLDCFMSNGVSELASVAGGGRDEVLSGAYDPVLATMERLLAVVDKLCAQSPVVLAVDDLQWADEPSLAVWAQLSRTVSQLPLLLIAACRPEPLRTYLSELRRSLETHDAVLVRLSPLTHGQTTTLVCDLLGAPPGPALAQLTMRAGGNPLYVRELVDVLAREGRLRIEPGVAAEVEGGRKLAVPASLRAAIADRIESMSQGTQRIVQTAALLGPEFSVTDLATVVACPAPELAGALMEAYRAHVLVDRGVRTAFRHPLIREALYEGIPKGLRSALHRQAAQALADMGVPVEQVAAQLEAASGVIDSWTLNWLVVNGAALVNRASQPAIDLLSRAADHIPRTDPRREVTESRLVAALRRMLRFDELERRTRGVLASGDISAEHRLEMSWELSYSLLYSDPSAAARVAMQALAADDGGRWGARLRALYAMILAVDGHCGDPWPAIHDAHAAAQRSGDNWATAMALNAESMMVGQQDPGRSVDLLQRALAAVGDDPQTADLRVILLSNLNFHLDNLGRPADADAAMVDVLAFAEKYPSAMALTRVRVYAAVWHYDMGRWDDALAELESIELRPEYGYITVEAISVAALIAAHRDDRAAAAAQLATLAAMPMTGLVVRKHSSRLVLARALAEERDGRLRAAFEVLAPTLSPERDVSAFERSHLLPELVRVAVAVGERDSAEAAAAQCAEDAKRELVPLRVAAAMACRGLLAGDPDLLYDAAERYRALHRPLERGMALENAAVLLAGQGKLPGARTAVTTALEEYGKLAAAWDTTRAEARMRPFGIRRGQRGPRDRPTFGWDSLTPTELRVAFLVADGLSNPNIGTMLFLSRRTVQTHVSHILAKLGARSRAEVASEASQHRGDTHDHRAPRSKSAS